MTADERAFLTAIIAAPDDDLPRLVYADWLDEHDAAARAEFIRTECQIQHLEPGHPERAFLFARRDQLRGAFKRDWFGSFLVGSVEWTTTRGFIEDVTTGPGELSDYGQDWFATQPIRRLWLRSVFTQDGGVRRWYHRELFRSPLMGRLTTLNLTHANVNSAGLYFLAQNAALSSLRELFLAHNLIDSEGAASLARMPALTQLRSLDLTHNQITDAGAQALARSTTLTSLDNLWMGRNLLTSVGWKALDERFGKALVRDPR